MSEMKVSTAMCSALLFRTRPTMTTGLFPPLDAACVPIHGRPRQSFTMVSETSRESVSFQRPERSVWVEGSMRVTTQGFFNLTRTLVQLSGAVCGGKLVMALEGGYGLAGLAYGVVASFAAMLGDDTVADPVGPARYAEKPLDPDYVDQLRALHDLPSK